MEKNRLGEVFSLALLKGPQRVSWRNDAVVILAERDYDKLTKKRQDFKEFLMNSDPSFESLMLTRDPSPMRANYEGLVRASRY